MMNFDVNLENLAWLGGRVGVTEGAREMVGSLSYLGVSGEGWDRTG